MSEMASMILTSSLLQYNGKYIEHKLEQLRSKNNECWIIIDKLIS